MSILVVGSVALDSIETPFGKHDDLLGGSATYFSIAASRFSPVKMVAVVGDDFPEAHIDFLKGRGVDVEGLEVREGKKTFRWRGRYVGDMGEAETLETQLNVFEEFSPDLPESYRETEFVFLANIHPALQSQVLDQMRGPRFVAADSMNLWIDTELDALKDLLPRIDALVINGGEARLLSGEGNLARAASRILEMGPKAVIVKRDEHGVTLFSSGGYFAVPAYPLKEVKDPTGAGDCFAGGFMGSLAREGVVSGSTIRRALVFGSVMASFAVEDFSLEKIKPLTPEEIYRRFEDFKSFTVF